MLDNFREWLSDNLRYILLGAAAVLVIVIIICAVRLIGGSSSRKAATPATTSAADTQTTEAAGTTALAGGSGSLDKDDEAILALAKQYYTAVASEDDATLSVIVNPWNDTVKKETYSSLIESYDNISTYSKAGPVDKSYVVYVYYDGKVSNITTPVPSLSMLYVTTNESGKLVVSDRNASQEVSDYISKVTSDADVQALIKEVNDKCTQAAASDPGLKALLAGQSSQEQTTETDSSSGSKTSGGTATANSGVNVRSEASTNGSVLGVLYQGQEVTVTGTEGDWTKISYTDSTSGSTVEGYVSTQYLTIAGASDSTAQGSSSSGTGETTAQTDAGTSTATGNDSSSTAGSPGAADTTV